MSVSYVSYSPCILLFSTRLCVTWQLRSMWRKFSYGRNNFQKLILILDPDTLTDMVSIMVNKIEYKPSVKDIMDKYYEMFRVKNSPNKKMQAEYDT